MQHPAIKGYRITVINGYWFHRSMDIGSNHSRDVGFQQSRGIRLLASRDIGFLQSMNVGFQQPRDIRFLASRYIEFLGRSYRSRKRKGRRTVYEGDSYSLKKYQQPTLITNFNTHTSYFSQPTVASEPDILGLVFIEAYSSDPICYYSKVISSFLASLLLAFLTFRPIV